MTGRVTVGQDCRPAAGHPKDTPYYCVPGLVISGRLPLSTFPHHDGNLIGALSSLARPASREDRSEQAQHRVGQQFGHVAKPALPILYRRLVSEFEALARRG
jgi:hypothetical protein